MNGCGSDCAHGNFYGRGNGDDHGCDRDYDHDCGHASGYGRGNDYDHGYVHVSSYLHDHDDASHGSKINL